MSTPVDHRKNHLTELSLRALGDQGLAVPALGLGCLGMSALYGRALPEADAIRVIHRALDYGPVMLDTADIYGPETNERLIGKAIAGRRDKVIVATKFGGAITGLREAHGDRRTVLDSCDASLRRLGIDHIDLYYQHRVDFTVEVEETFGALAELVTAGKVRYAGICEASADRIRRAHEICPLTAVQTEWSLWSRDIEASVLPAARALGIGVVAYSPLGRGFLTGTITSPEDLDDDDVRRHTMPRFERENLERNRELVTRLDTIAARHGATSGQLALAWVLARGDDVVAIPGTRRTAYLDENMAAAGLTLSETELIELDEAFPTGAASGDRYGAASATYIED